MPYRIQPIRKLETRCIFCGMQRVVFHEKIPTFPVAYKGFYTFNEQNLFIYFYYFFNQNYVLSRNVAIPLYIFKLNLFAVKALKSDVLC